MEYMLKDMMVSVVPLLRACAPYVLTLMVLIVGSIIYFYTPFWGVWRIPGPPTAFLVGHLPLLAQYGPDIFRILAKNYGPIYRFHMGRRPLVIVADPELCREVGIKKFKYIKNRSSPSPTSGSPLHEEGLFLTRDSRWSSMRNTIIPLYQPSHIASLVPTMQSHVDSLFLNVTKTEEGTDVPFSELALKMAIDIIGETAFGIQFGLTKEIPDPQKDHGASRFLKQHTHSIESLKMDLTSSLSTVLGLVAPFLQKPCREVLKRIPGTCDYKMHRTNKSLCERLDAIIAERSTDGTRGKDFLGTVLKARDSGAAKGLFTQSYIRALTYEHLLAGTKTSAFTLAMTVYLLSVNPEVEKKLLREIDSFGSCEAIPTADDINCKFPYLDQVVKETMRFCTVSPLVARETSQEVEIGGYMLPKGTWVWLALGVLAKDPNQFPDPDAFRPERFDPDCDEEKRRHPYAHIPFGIGPRACIGKRFAIQEVKLALIRLYRTYVFRHSPKMESPLELEYGLVLGFKHGVVLHAIKRRFQNCDGSACTKRNAWFCN